MSDTNDLRKDSTLGEPVRPATPPQYGQYWSEADIKQRIKEIESKHMSDWTDEEMQFYNEITGQPAAPAVPDAAARLAKMTESRDAFGQAALNNRIDLDLARELLQKVLDSPLGDHIQQLRSEIKRFLIREAGEMRPAPDATRFEEFDDPQHPAHIWWEKHGQYMMAGGGRKEYIWACRGWIAREQLLHGAEVTGESMHEHAASPAVPPKLAAEQFLEVWLKEHPYKVRSPSTVMVDFAEAYAQHVAAGETRDLEQARETARELNRRNGALQHTLNTITDRNVWYGYYKAALSLYGWEEDARKKAESEALKLREALEKHEHMAKMLREMAESEAANPGSLTLVGAAAVLLGSLRPVTEADIKRAKELAEKHGWLAGEKVKP